MYPVTNDLLEQLDRHLASANQAWLFGAGISYTAGIPLMGPLTTRVLAIAETSKYKGVLDALFNELKADSHIEHLLSQLGDYITLAKRSKIPSISIDGTSFDATELEDAHKEVVQWIADTVRWGYRPKTATNPEDIGKHDNSLVTISSHKEFMEALFNRTRAGLNDRTNSIRLFSTNYDTLIEDALALNEISYWDGFSGGGVAYRSYHFGAKLPAELYRTYVIKLHGSIDWQLCDGKVRRVRNFDTYPTGAGYVMIYPQATKYVATQLDPFAAQFDLFRQTLSTSSDNVLAVCGYSFSDDHINHEIKYAMSSPSNRTTLLAFHLETPAMAECLDEWRNSAWGNRLYIVTEKGLYVGNSGPHHAPSQGKEHNWWTFEGVTTLLKDGAEGYAT